MDPRMCICLLLGFSLSFDAGLELILNGAPTWSRGSAPGTLPSFHQQVFKVIFLQIPLFITIHFSKHRLFYQPDVAVTKLDCLPSSFALQEFNLNLKSTSPTWRTCHFNDIFSYFIRKFNWLISKHFYIHM